MGKRKKKQSFIVDGRDVGPELDRLMRQQQNAMKQIILTIQSGKELRPEERTYTFTVSTEQLLNPPKPQQSVQPVAEKPSRRKSNSIWPIKN